MVHMVDIDTVGMVQVHSVNGGEIDDGDEKVLGVMHSQWSQKGGRSGREGVGKPLQGKATIH